MLVATLLNQLYRAPWIDTELARAAARKAHRSIFIAIEINALRKLATNRANNAPRLVAELHTKQDDDGIVPTGFISYILITWCPGVPLSDGDYKRKPKSEQDEIFEAFEEALE